MNLICDFWNNTKAALESLEATALQEGYTIDCTGDACLGDEILILEPQFAGSYSRKKSATCTGQNVKSFKIIKDSYGAAKQQHTFTLQHGEELCLKKGRNIYYHKTYRKPWENEEKRKEFIAEKHERGDKARAVRRERRGY